MHKLLIDSVLLGLAVAALGFPLWITFSAFLGTISNNTANMNWRGAGKTLLAFPAGALVGYAVSGFTLSPATGWPATFFCIVGLSAYLIAMGNISFARISRLRLTREALGCAKRSWWMPTRPCTGSFRKSTCCRISSASRPTATH